MNMISIISSDGHMEKGKFIVPLSFCINNHCKGKCKEFYQHIVEKDKNIFLYLSIWNVYICFSIRNDIFLHARTENLSKG